jgi:hypothetical protein
LISQAAEVTTRHAKALCQTLFRTYAKFYVTLFIPILLTPGRCTMDHTEPDVLSNLNSLSSLSLRGWLYVCPMILPLLSGCGHPYTPPRAFIYHQIRANVLKSSSPAVSSLPLPAQPQSGAHAQGEGLDWIGSMTCAGG